MSHTPHNNSHHELSNTDQPSPAHPHPIPLPEHPLPTNESTHPSSSFLCTICRDDSSDASLHGMVPSCLHVFCLSCVLSWAQVREVCPNCKASFSSLLVHRDLTGAIAPGPVTISATLPWIREHVALLQRVEWVQTREVLPPLQDLADAITLAPQPSDAGASAAAGVGRSPAPHYLHEDVEDELESRFWEEEEKQFDRLMGGSRVMSNRRFGANGYISSGRLRATPRQRLAAQARKKGASSGGSAGAGAASAANAGGRAQEVAAERREQMTKTQSKGSCSGRSGSGSGSGSGSASASASASSGGGRKKKLKKKSREGIAAAARKKAEAEAAANLAAAAASASAAGAGSGAEQAVVDGTGSAGGGSGVSGSATEAATAQVGSS